MAMSSLLLKPCYQILPKNHSTSNTKHTPKPFTCRNCLRVTQSPISKDYDYKQSWKEELKNAFLLDYDLKNDGDDEKFQEMVDKRCVDNIRMLIVDSVQNAKAGHPGMAMGMAEVGYFLYRHAMRYNPRNPGWFNRDRFVLSAGHGCLLQYVCLQQYTNPRDVYC